MTINGIFRGSLTNTFVGLALILSSVFIFFVLIEFDFIVNEKLLLVFPLISFLGIVCLGVGMIIGIKELIKKSHVWSALISILLGGIGFFYIFIGLLISSAMP